jgi:hypothetical protein
MWRESLRANSSARPYPLIFHVALGDTFLYLSFTSLAFTLYFVVVGTPLHSPLPLSIGRQRTPVVGVHEFLVGKVKECGREGTSSLVR